MKARNRNKSNDKFMILLLAVMLIQAVRYFPFKFGGWNQIQLSFTYAYGLIQRAFLGTILDVVSTLFHIPLKYMRFLYGIVTMVLFTLLLGVSVRKALEKSSTDSLAQKFFMGMSILFFVGPGWDTYYNNFALTDLWMLMLSVTGVFVVLRGKHLWVAFVVSIIGVLVHTAYVFMYFNFVLAAFAYQILVQEKESAKKYVCWLIPTFLSTSAMFLYMMFFSHAKEGITIDYVMNRTAEFVGRSVEEIKHHQYTVEGYLFRNGDTGIKLEITSYWLLFLVMVALFSPFLYEIYRYWKEVYHCAKQSGSKNCWLYALLPMGVLTVVPMYIMHNDYGRWTYAVFFYEFMWIWVLNLIQDTNAHEAAKQLMMRVSSNKLYYIVLIFYAAVLGAFEQNLVSPLISTIESYGWKIIG